MAEVQSRGDECCGCTTDLLCLSSDDHTDDYDLSRQCGSTTTVLTYGNAATYTNYAVPGSAGFSTDTRSLSSFGSVAVWR